MEPYSRCAPNHSLKSSMEASSAGRADLGVQRKSAFILTTVFLNSADFGHKICKVTFFSPENKFFSQRSTAPGAHAAGHDSSVKRLQPSRTRLRISNSLKFAFFGPGFLDRLDTIQLTVDWILESIRRDCSGNHENHESTPG